MGLHKSVCRKHSSLIYLQKPRNNAETGDELLAKFKDLTNVLQDAYISNNAKIVTSGEMNLHVQELVK